MVRRHGSGGGGPGGRQGRARLQPVRGADPGRSGGSETSAPGSGYGGVVPGRFGVPEAPGRFGFRGRRFGTPVPGGPRGGIWGGKAGLWVPLARADPYHGRMSFLRRRSAATPTGPDFDVLAMDPGDWPGDLGAGLLPGPDGSCQGIYLRYDLFGGRAPRC